MAEPADFKQAMDTAKKAAAKKDKAEAERKKALSPEEQKKELESGKETEKKTDEKKTDQPKLKGAVDKEQEAEDRKKLKDLTKPKFDMPPVTG